MLDQLRIAGSTGVHLHVASKNFRAQEFYKKLNFTIYSTAENENIMGLAL
jgi:ribosomal protein S18 acetylase RimI-like enzyme